MAQPDPMLSMLEWLCKQLMEAEVTETISAEKNERSANRTGYRARRLDTRMGTMYLMVPKLRNGGYILFFVAERKRSEVALIQVVQKAFIQGVSTRKMEKLAQSLGIENLSRSQVSEMAKGLNELVDALSNEEIIGPLRFFIITFCGIYVCLYLAKLIKITHFIRRYFQLMGTYSFEIMACHFLTTKLIDLIYTAIIGETDRLVYGTFVSASSKECWFIYALFGTLAPALVALGIKRIWQPGLRKNKLWRNQNRKYVFKIKRSQRIRISLQAPNTFSQ